MRTRPCKDVAILRSKNDVLRAGDIDAMRKRLANQLGIDQRHHPADPADAEPAGDVFGPARHHQADRLAEPNSLTLRPAGILVDPSGK